MASARGSLPSITSGWTALRAALLLAALAGALLSGVSVRGQDLVMLTSGDGCIADSPPGPPGNLKATPKDGKVLLQWDAPASGGCVSAFVINVYDPSFRVDQPAQSTSTGGRSAVVEGLTNNKTYKFEVQAYNSNLKGGGVALATASPSDRCDDSVPPGAPTNLRVQTGAGWARLCWDGVQNDACVDEYRLSAKLLSGPAFRSSGSNGKISRGGCANVTGLQTDAQYSFTVLPVSAKRGQGTPSSVTAVVGATAATQNGWTCKSVDGCAPNRGGRCNAGGCGGVARRGECGVPAMVDVDWVNKQVTQWCSSACPCQLGPAQGGSLMGVPRPASAGLTGGFGAPGSFGALAGLFGGLGLSRNATSGSGGSGGSVRGSAPAGGSGIGAVGGGSMAESLNDDDSADSAPPAERIVVGSSRGSFGSQLFGSGGGSVPVSTTPTGTGNPAAGSLLSALFSGGNGAGAGGAAAGGGGSMPGLSPFSPAGGASGGPVPALGPFSPIGGAAGAGAIPPLGPALPTPPNPAGAVGAAVLQDFSRTRTGQFMTNIADDYVKSGVIGEAAGKVASQVVSNQVNAMVQSMWSAAQSQVGPNPSGRRAQA